MKEAPDFVAKAHAAWGPACPDWVLELAALCGTTSQGAAASRIGMSAATVSQVLSNTYRGNMAGVEERVRGALMGATVACPVLGDIARNACLDWQKTPFAASDSFRVRVFRACRNSCPHSRIKP